MSAEDYCELCDLPKSQCIHGNPPAPPPAPVRKAKPRASSPSAKQPAASTRRLPRKWTPPDEFRSAILLLLEEAGGELEQQDLFVVLEQRMGERLTEGDHEKTPEGELRWRYAARRARQALIAEGAMTRSRPGVWALA